MITILNEFRNHFNIADAINIFSSLISRRFVWCPMWTHIDSTFEIVYASHFTRACSRIFLFLFTLAWYAFERAFGLVLFSLFATWIMYNAEKVPLTWWRRRYKDKSDLVNIRWNYWTKSRRRFFPFHMLVTHTWPFRTGEVNQKIIFIWNILRFIRSCYMRWCAWFDGAAIWNVIHSSEHINDCRTNMKRMHALWWWWWFVVVVVLVLYTIESRCFFVVVFSFFFSANDDMKKGSTRIRSWPKRRVSVAMAMQ